MRHFSLFFASLLSTITVLGQAPGPSIGSPANYAGERIAVLSGLPSVFHGEIKPIGRKDLWQLANALDTSTTGRKLAWEKAYLIAENTEFLPDSVVETTLKHRKGLLRWFYRSPANFFEVNQKGFKLRVNPILHGELGKLQGDSGLVFANRRGLELRGSIDDKIWFVTNVVEQQARFANYVQDRIAADKAIPAAGFYKPFKSRLFAYDNAYDYNVAQAYIGFQATKHVGIQFGHGNNFIGTGHRSLFLSDFGNNYFFLKCNTRVWKFHYQNIFMELTPFSKGANPDGNGADVRLPSKYAAVHYLSFKPVPKVSIGFFEATVFNRSRQFEFQYLNPIVLYRTVEGMIGSPDNVLAGLNLQWDVANRLRLYGQVLLDEFFFKELFQAKTKGWWANKYAFQGGLKYFNAFNINRLDVQLEYNYIRPFTYSHADSLNSWTHYSHPMAHPLGANVQEFIAILRYQPIRRLGLQARFFNIRNADDPAGQNWGNRLLRSNLSRQIEYGNVMGQGVGATVRLFTIEASYQIFHNGFVDLKYWHRNKDSQDNALDRNTKMIQAGIRLNFQAPNLDF
jgi:hypothetical protein